MRTGERVDADLERRLLAPSCKMKRRAADTVTAHLWNGAVRVDDIHPRRVDIE